MSALGNLIARNRELTGMSLQDVADAAGITKAHVWGLERGNSCNPCISTLLGLAEALTISPNRLAAAAFTDQPCVEMNPRIAKAQAARRKTGTGEGASAT